MPLGLGPCRCCKCPPIATEGFERPDADTLGASWDEQAGSWAVEDGTACTTSTDALALWLRWTDHSGWGGYNHRLALKVRGASGDVARVFFHHRDGGDQIVEFVFGGPGEVRTKSSTGGVETTHRAASASLAADTWHDVVVCHTDTAFTGYEQGWAIYVDDALVFESPIAAVGGPSTPYDRRIAIGTGDTAADVRFDSLKLSPHHLATFDLDCPTCAACLWPNIPQAAAIDYNATITPSDLDQVITCTWRSGSFGHCYFEGGETTPLGLGPGWIAWAEESDTPGQVKLHATRGDFGGSGVLDDYELEIDVTTSDGLISDGPYTLPRIGGSASGAGSAGSTVEIEAFPV